MTTDENSKLRKLLWLNHGCKWPDLYGDDGNWQCLKHFIDFKKDSADIIERKLSTPRAKGVWTVITVSEPVPTDSLARASGTAIAFRPPIDLEPEDLCMVVIATGELLEVVRNDVVVWRKD
jgi:hypothetical protein